MTSFQRFRSDNRKPAFDIPPLSSDCQVHVYGDLARYPIRPNSAYTPYPDATIDAALDMHRTLGISRGVVVQATVHGTDHRILFDALKTAGAAYRGVAIVNDSVSNEDLTRLHAAGVRGARFNFWRQLNIAPSADEFRRSIRRISEFGWLAKIHNAGEAWLEIEDLLLEAKLPVVIDHLGHVDLSKGVDQPVFRMFWRLIERGNFWIMASNSDRYSVQERGWDDARAFLSAVIERAPDRTIWCTDWPHVQYRKPMPTDTELIELLCQATPDLEQRRKVLSENPTRLFGFENR
jgi:predicted TIM-barrel fold metal-dependent hydrolase